MGFNSGFKGLMWLGSDLYFTGGVFESRPRYPLCRYKRSITQSFQAKAGIVPHIIQQSFPSVSFPIHRSLITLTKLMINILLLPTASLNNKERFEYLQTQPTYIIHFIDPTCLHPIYLSSRN